MAADDPSRKLQGKQGQAPRGITFHTASLGILVLLPWWMFTMISCLFCFAYHQLPGAVWAFVAVCVVISCVFVGASLRKLRERPMFWLFLGVLCLIGCAAASLVGFFNFQSSMASYWAYEESRVYLNVLPASSAEAHSDAGVIKFAADAAPSTNSSLGYSHGGNKYCVAPILGPQPAKTVEFWAAGTDCCSTGDFTCDDAKKKGAHGGARIFDSASAHASRLPYYKKAAEEAAAFYNLVASKDPIFVHWMTNPLKAQDDAWWWSAHVLIVAISVHFCISVGLALLVHLGSRPGKRAPGWLVGRYSQCV